MNIPLAFIVIKIFNMHIYESFLLQSINYFKQDLQLHKT